MHTARTAYCSPPPFSWRRTLLLTASTLTVTLAWSAHAQDPMTLNTVTVTGSATPPDMAPGNARNAFRIPESSSSHSQTITREEIEQLRPTDVFELLNNATGVIATQGSRKGFSGLSIRGDSNFRWIVDGAYLQPNMAGRIMRNIPVMAIEEVTVVRGASALTMGPMTGSASPGGAPVDGFVIVRTRKPTRDGGQARLAVESFDTVQAGVWAGKMLGNQDAKGYVAGLVNYSDTNGPDELLDNGAGYNTWRTAEAGLFKAGLNTAGWLIDFMAYRDNGEFGIPNANNHFTSGTPPTFGTNGNWRIDPSQSNIYVVSGSKKWGESQTTLFNLSRTESHQILTTTTANLNDNENTHLNLRHNIDFGKTRLQLGGDYQHWNNPSGMNYFEGIPREEKTSGWFGQVEQSLLGDKLTLDLSYRQDTVKVVRGLDYYTAGAQPPGGLSSPLIYQNRTLPEATFYSAGASWRVDDKWKVTARYGENEQASNGLNPMPGVVLGDDQQKKWEIGVEGQINPLFNPALSFFHREVKNEKSVKGFTYVQNNAAVATCLARVATTPAPFASRWNGTSDITECYGQDDTLRAGLELTVSGNFAERSSYRASLTQFTDRKNVETTTPHRIADLSLTHGMGAWTLTSALKYVSAYKGSATDAGAYLGGYTRVDLGVGYDTKLGSTPVKTTLYGRNLGDKKYETSNGVQDAGRVIGVEVTASF